MCEDQPCDAQVAEMSSNDPAGGVASDGRPTWMMRVKRLEDMLNVLILTLRSHFHPQFQRDGLDDLIAQHEAEALEEPPEDVKAK